jgi:hypothetical protein
VSKLVIARFRDGRMIKGTSLDVAPNRPMFHVVPPGERAVEVQMADLKALFFVRSLAGNPGYRESTVPDPKDPRLRGATLVSLSFGDGETMVGMMIGYPPKKPYFFLTPVDPNSNNIRTLVNRDAVTAMELIGRV